MSDEVAEDLAAFGLSDEIADVPRESELNPDLYGVWPENVVTLNIFVALETQWEMVAVEGELVRTRLLYESFEIVKGYVNGVRPGEWADILATIRRMELAALGVFRKERKERLERARQEEAARRAGM